MKRLFEPHGDELQDTIRDEEGRQHHFVASKVVIQAALKRGSLLSPSTAPEKTETTAETRPARRAPDSLPPPPLATLLKLLEQFDVTVPMALLGHLEDLRVRPALLAAAKAVPALQLRNFARALGLSGGPGVLELLLTRREELLEDPRTFEQQRLFQGLSQENTRASGLVAVATAELTLDSGCTSAAEALVRLMEHPCSGPRNEALGAAQGFGRADVRNEAFECLRRALLPHLQTLEALAFAQVVGSLRELAPEAALARCKELLSGSRTMGRWEAILALGRLGPRHEGHAVLLAHLAREPLVRLQELIADVLGSALPMEQRAGVARRALSDDSPGLRYQALYIAESLPPELKRELARVALQDEPDPSLQALLQQMTGEPNAA